jgi:nucleoside-diphosphate-sugar epimerase
MRYICTGGSGFIGTNLIEKLVSDQNEVLNIDIQKPRNAFQNDYWIECDIRNVEKLEEITRKYNPDFFIHLAARTDLNGKTLEDYSANTLGVSSVINAVKKTDGIRSVLFASSRLVCKIGYLPKSEDDYFATTLYGQSKVIGEKIVRDQAKNLTCPWLIFRPTSIWGPWFGTPYKEFFMSILHRHYVHPKGRMIRKSFGYVGNAVFALEKMAINFPQVLKKKTIYLCDYEPIEVLDWSKKIASMAGISAPPEVDMSILKTLAWCGNLMKKAGVKEPPLTSFRLNNILTNMIYDTSHFPPRKVFKPH